MNQTPGSVEEITRIKRVSDTLCSSHANLRDRYARLGLIFDVIVLGLSTWLVALSFVDPRVNTRLTPFGIEPQIWVGVLGAATFLLTLMQSLVNWKGRSDAHKRTLDLYAEVKREAGYLLAANSFDDADFRRVLSRYDMASAVGVEIPEADFLPQKRHHKLKIALSKHLDDHPAAWLPLTRLKFWLRDNF